METKQPITLNVGSNSSAIIRWHMADSENPHKTSYANILGENPNILLISDHNTGESAHTELFDTKVDKKYLDDVIEPLKTTVENIVVDTPLWTNQPTTVGPLNPAFVTSDYYFATLKDTAGAALPANQFKLMPKQNDYQNAINQIFTLSGLNTGNSGLITENKTFEFKTISTDRLNFGIRNAGVSRLTIPATNKEKLTILGIYKVAAGFTDWGSNSHMVTTPNFRFDLNSYNPYKNRDYLLGQALGVAGFPKYAQYDFKFVFNFSERNAFLDAGEYMAYGTTSDLTANYGRTAYTRELLVLTANEGYTTNAITVIYLGTNTAAPLIRNGSSLQIIREVM